MADRFHRERLRGIERKGTYPMSRVILRRAAYEYSDLKRLVYETLESLIPGRIGRGCRVVIKPNLLAPASPEKAILTHPLMVRAVAEYVLDKGARPQVSDSPAMGTFRKVMKESGIMGALEGLDVECREFLASASVDIGEPFGKIEIARDALEADVLINLPKLKTHSQMLLTLGVKNLFGCVVGFRKPEWHLRTGVDREMFALLLVRLYETIKPAVTVLDGVLGMEGEGPGTGGAPRHIGVVLAGTDALAVDAVVCKMLGLAADALPTNRAAKRIGLTPASIDLEGELPGVRDFRLPNIVPLVFGPACFHSVLRRHLVQRPVLTPDSCKSCGDCLRYCPAGAIAQEKKRIAFDYDKCIRCYCCIEVCPHGALKTEEPLLGKIVNRVMKRN